MVGAGSCPAVRLLVSRWSRQTGWDDRHRLAVAGGALLTYVWASFPVPPEGDDTARIDLVSNSVFGAVALVILLLAVRRTLDWTKIGRGTTQEAHTQPGR